MALTYNDISALVADNKSPAQIADILAADVRHVQDTNAAAIYRLLVNNLRVMHTEDNVWTGDLPNAIKASGDAELLAGFNQLISNPWSESEVISTGSDVRVAQLATAMAGIAASIIGSREDDPRTPADVLAALHSHTGGPRFAGVTADDVQACIDAQTAANDVEADETRHEVLLSANRSTDGKLRVVARVTPVEFADGEMLRRGQSENVMSDELAAAVSAIVEGLI